jgi:hypothetical protein
MKRILVLSALFLVLLSSGCTVPLLDIEIPFLPDIFGGVSVQEQRHDVISIESLQAIPSSTVRAGQTMRLRAVVKNLQSPEYDKTTVTIGLYNDCGLFGLDEKNEGVSGEFCSGTTAPRYNPATGMSECTIEMHPQSTALVEWKLTARENLNVETPCKMGVMAKYKYRTFSTASVTFVNKAELERIISEGKSFSETGILSIGEGPVKPYIEVLNQPLVIDAEGDVKNQGGGIMSFWIENKGGGILELSDSSTPNVDISTTDCKNMDQSQKKLCLKISSEFVTAIDTNGNQNAIIRCIETHLKSKANGNDIISINFIGKATPKYSCAITAADRTRIKQELTSQITAEIGYWYKFTKELSITVEPKIKL